MDTLILIFSFLLTFLAGYLIFIGLSIPALFPLATAILGFCIVHQGENA